MFYANRYTGWLEVTLLSPGKARIICNALRKWFRIYGVPEELYSDDGPPFDSNEHNAFLSD